MVAGGVGLDRAAWEEEEEWATIRRWVEQTRQVDLEDGRRVVD